MWSFLCELLPDVARTAAEIGWRIWHEGRDSTTPAPPPVPLRRPMTVVEEVMDLRALVAARKARRVLPFPTDPTPSAVADVMELRRAREQRRP